MERTTAVFHGRDHMEHAVHALSERGIRRDHIGVAPTTAESARPTDSRGVPGHLIGAGVCGALGGMVGLTLSGGSDALSILWSVIFATLLGAAIGGILGFTIARLRRLGSTHAHDRHDLWRVRVDAIDGSQARSAERVLRAEGGDIVAT